MKSFLKVLAAGLLISAAGEANAQITNVINNLSLDGGAFGSFVLSAPTSGSGIRTFTFPSTSGTLITTSSGVAYGTTSTQNTSDISATKYLFDLSYAATVVDQHTLGARINSTNTSAGANLNATGLSITADAGAGGTATALSLNALGGTNNYELIASDGTLNTNSALSTTANFQVDGVSDIGDGTGADNVDINTGTGTFVLSHSTATTAASSEIASFVQTTGAAANGFGSHLSFTLENAAAANIEAGRVGFYWDDATAGNSSLGFVTASGGALNTRMTLNGDGLLDVASGITAGAGNAFSVNSTGALSVGGTGIPIIPLSEGVHLGFDAGAANMAVQIVDNGGTPYIDFTNDLTNDNDARIMLSSNDVFDVTGAAWNVAMSTGGAITGTTTGTAGNDYGVKGVLNGAPGSVVTQYAVWGQTTSAATANTVNQIGVRAQGNGNSDDALTNVALNVVHGSITVGRQATSAADNTTNIIPVAEDDGSTTSTHGPSGVVDFGAIAAPAANESNTATLQVFNVYANSASIVLCTILNTNDANFDAADESATVTVEGRAAGEFTIRVTRNADASGSGGGNWTPRVGFVIINADK